MALDSGILDVPFPEAAKLVISERLWGRRRDAANGTDVNLEPYWTYYSNECSNALHDGGRHVATRMHHDVVDCVDKLRDGMLRDDIKASLRSRLTAKHANEDEMLDNSIDLAASLLLMTSFGSYSFGFSGRSRVCWSGGDGSLRDFVHRYFGAGPALAKESVKLEKTFVARNLDRIAGLEITWTDNLADHLRMADDDGRVHIFHHASFLEMQRRKLVHRAHPPGVYG